MPAEKKPRPLSLVAPRLITVNSVRYLLYRGRDAQQYLGIRQQGRFDSAKFDERASTFYQPIVL